MIINSYPFVKLDYTLPPEQLVVNLINNDNGTEFTPNMLVFGIPVLLYKGKHNSKVKVSAAAKSRFTGSTFLTYNRVDLEDVAIGKSTLFDVDARTQKKISDLIPAIDARYSLKLTPADYVDGPLPAITDEVVGQETVELVAANTSLIFINKLILQIELAGQIMLIKIIKNIYLSGLKYIEPVLPALIADDYYEDVDIGGLIYVKPQLSMLIDY